MYCSKCGNELKEGENFCSKCGNNIENKKDDNNNENRQNEEKAKSRKRNIIVVIIVSIFLIPCLFFIGIAIGTNVTTTNKNTIKETKNSSYKESNDNVDIDEESKNNIKKLYSKISGYGSSNIIKAIYWKLVDGTPAIKIAYSNTSRNGMYITVDRKVYVEYGDQEDLYKGSGQNKRQANELFFTMYKDDKEHIFLTGDEFRSIIK